MSVLLHRCAASVLPLNSFIHGFFGRTALSLSVIEHYVLVMFSSSYPGASALDVVLADGLSFLILVLVILMPPP